MWNKEELEIIDKYEKEIETEPLTSLYKYFSDLSGPTKMRILTGIYYLRGGKDAFRIVLNNYGIQGKVDVSFALFAEDRRTTIVLLKSFPGYWEQDFSKAGLCKDMIRTLGEDFSRILTDIFSGIEIVDHR